MAQAQARDGSPVTHDKLLFWGCFMALIATAFGFVVRSMVLNEWGREFSLTATEQGRILGVGLWPFSISIVLFSLFIDRIGYGRAMVFAFVCHVLSAIITILAHGKDGSAAFNMLYWGTFIAALGNGTVEAVINPVVATMFSRDKTKWLNILHAGWPGGMVLAGLLALSLGDAAWTYKIALVFIPVIIYGIMLFGRRFPIHERVAAGVSDRAMLAEAGILGALIVIGLMTWEVGNFFALPVIVRILIIAALTGVYGAYVRSFGRPLFIFLLFIMMPLATTELGTDSWITPIMENSMTNLGLPAVSVLLYTATIMMLLRFFAGPIIHRLSPLGLLATCSLIAALGLIALSRAEGIAILAAATIYGVGKSFFWPTMLGVVAERFPRGGALTMNAIAGVGMLSVGIVGAVFLGAIQDRYTTHALEQQNPQLHDKYTVTKVDFFGDYEAVDQATVETAPAGDKDILTAVRAAASKNALQVVATFPLIMFVCYLILIFYFRGRGGYSAVHLSDMPDHVSEA